MSKREFKPFLGYIVDGSNGSNIRIILNTFRDGSCVAVACNYHRKKDATQEDLERFLNSNNQYFVVSWNDWRPIIKKKKVPMEWWECARKINELRAEIDLTKEEIVVRDCNDQRNPMTNICFHADMNVEDWEYSTINLLTGEIDQNWKKFEKEVEMDDGV